jgi:hypothetical protein
MLPTCCVVVKQSEDFPGSSEPSQLACIHPQPRYCLINTPQVPTLVDSRTPRFLCEGNIECTGLWCWGGAGCRMVKSLGLAGCVSGLRATMSGEYESDKNSFLYPAFFCVNLSLTASIRILLCHVLVPGDVSHNASSNSSSCRLCAGSATKD